MHLQPGKVTLEQALHAAESNRWYGQSLMREIASVLAKEVRRLQATENPHRLRCPYISESDDRCILEQGHTGLHDLG
jgi:hypothetical protein